MARKESAQYAAGACLVAPRKPRPPCRSANCAGVGGPHLQTRALRGGAGPQHCSCCQGGVCGARSAHAAVRNRCATTTQLGVAFTPLVLSPLLGRSCCVLRCQPSPKKTRPSTSRGRQRPASQVADDFCHQTCLRDTDAACLRETDAAVAALLESQAGPPAARVLTTRPTLPQFALVSALLQCHSPLPDADAAHATATTSPPARASSFSGRRAALSTCCRWCVQGSWCGHCSRSACP